MDWLLSIVARALVAGLQALPLPAVARLGRTLGGIAWWCDARHRRVALANLDRCLGRELSRRQIRILARENFRRIGENFACGVRTAAMTDAEVRKVVEVRGADKLMNPATRADRPSCLVAIGHFGNFELFARCGMYVPGYRFATTYRALRQPGLDRVFQSLREQSGCRFFERRTEAEALKNAMNEGGVMLGLLSDQHGGKKGVWGPFLGQECSTTAAPAIFALRYHAPIFCAFCYRVNLGRWRLEVGDEIPIRDDQGRPRAVEAIIREMNLQFEAAVRRDPANWFWVHRRWKPRGKDTAHLQSAHSYEEA
jgi:KDO2-lipid IV(A) lauroyltransferase